MTMITECQYTKYYKTALYDFNFYKVALAMKALSWSWVTATEDGSGIPTINEMKQACNRLFNAACEIEGPDKVASSGGFKVSIFSEEEPALVRIEFILEHSDSD